MHRWYSWEDDYEDGKGHQQPTEDDALVLTGPVRAKSKRGPFGVTWWGQQWVAVMERLRDARLDRGKSYARNGSVRDLTIQKGMVSARVQGSYYHPYETSVELRILAEKEWETVMNALAGQAVYAAKLLAGEMPQDIEGVFQSVGMSLFPQSRQDIAFECSCPDWGDPCKHAAAVYYLIAEQLDADPFTLFHLRGYTRQQVLDALRRRREESAPNQSPSEDLQPQTTPTLDADLDAFWSGDASGLVRSVPQIPDQPPFLVQLGDSPGGFGNELRTIYQTVSKVALEWLGREAKPADESLNDDDTTAETPQTFEYGPVRWTDEIPAIPDRDRRIEEVLTDAYGYHEHLAAMEVYLTDCLQTPFEATWDGEPVTVLGVGDADERRGIRLDIKHGSRQRRVMADEVHAKDRQSVNAIVLDDHRYWLEHGGGIDPYDGRY